MKKYFPWIFLLAILVILILGGRSLLVQLTGKNIQSERASAISVLAALSETPPSQSSTANALALTGASPDYLPLVIKQPTLVPVTPPLPTSTPTFTSIPTTASTSLPVESTTAFAIGLGGADVIPHQIVRANDDRLYVFGCYGDMSSQLNAYWTTSAGLPNSGSDFTGSLEINDSADILAVEVVYDGAQTIHVLTSGQDGKIKDRLFDLSTHNYRSEKVLGTDGATVNGKYAGSSGLSAMMARNGRLDVVHWTNDNHILFRSYTYDVSTDTLTPVEGPTQVDTGGSANHPALAISPTDGSVTVAWVSQMSTPAQILSRTEASGSWGTVQVASTAPVWMSTDWGINIDQGPSLLITPDGVKRLAYIEDFRTMDPNDYGRVHYVTDSGSGWVDQYTGFYSHDPALAVNSAGQIYIIGHGHPLNSVCASMLDMCFYRSNGNTNWTQKILIAHQGNQSFDSSPSVKWSIVGLNRPEAIEVVFAEVGEGYSYPVYYYGRID